MFTFLIGFNAQAATPAGGFITYKYLGNDKYLVQYQFLRACGGTSLSSITMGVFFGTPTNSKAGASYTLNPVRTKIEIIKTVCDSLVSNTCPNQGYEVHTYVDTLDFAGTQFSATYNTGSSLLITFYAQASTRLDTITTGPSGSQFYIQTQLISKINNVRIHNTSPEINFTKSSPMIARLNQPYKSVLVANDFADFDSFSFEFTPVLTDNNGSAATYNSPFSYLNPVSSFCLPPGTK